MRTPKLYEVKEHASSKGIYACDSIEPDTRILTFRGPRLTYARVARLANPDYALQVGSNDYILCARDGRFVNHSCEPNAGVRNLVDLVAIAPIASGDEITMDYSTTMDRWSECEFDCRCATRSCRKTITGFATLSRELRDRYLQLDIVPRFLR